MSGNLYSQSSVSWRFRTFLV